MKHFISGWAAAYRLYALHAFSIKCERHFPRNFQRHTSILGEKCFRVRRIWQKPSAHLSYTEIHSSDTVAKCLGLTCTVHGMLCWVLRVFIFILVSRLICFLTVPFTNSVHSLFSDYERSAVCACAPATPEMTFSSNSLGRMCHNSSIASMNIISAWLRANASLASYMMPYLSVSMYNCNSCVFTHLSSHFRASCFLNDEASIE